MRFSYLLVSLALAACSPAQDAPPERQEANPPASTPRPRAALLPEDIEGGALKGELACSFSESANGPPLLLARADVRDDSIADGLLKLGSSVLALRSAEGGGFNALTDGARFASGDLAATVTVTSPEPLGEGESPPRAARLTLETGAVPPDRIEGLWTCGP